MKTLRRNLVTLLILLLTGSWASSVAADIVTLGFSTLPSVQGWSYYTSPGGSHSDDVEANVFSVNAATLTGNTIGSGLVAPSGVGYQRLGVVNANSAWTLSWTMRVTEYENGTDLDFGSWFGVDNGDYAVGLALSTVSISVYDDMAITRHAFDTTGFHDYRYEYTPGIGPGTWELFIDNASSLTGTARTLATASNQLFIGDGTGARNASWEMTAYSFSVPEPSLGLLLGISLLGLVGVGTVRKIRQRAVVKVKS